VAFLTKGSKSAKATTVWVLMHLTRHQRHDIKRRVSQPWRAFYKTPDWQRLREDQLSKHPLCHHCLAKGQTSDAKVVHHVIPHEGDWQLFITGELQSLCKRCHDREAQQVEKRGYSTEIGLDGWPKSPDHPMNAGGPKPSY
jgi:5-methylcytosine-specific restriction enzyme A